MWHEYYICATIAERSIEKMNSYIISLAMIALKICSTVLPSYAARPFVTDDAGTVALETFELETGVDFWKDAATGCNGLKHGVTDRMDLGFGFGYSPQPEDERGFSGAELGLKFAIVPELLAVTAAGSFGSSTFAINGILSKAFGPVSFDGNLGMEAQADGNDADLTYAVCCHYRAVAKLKQL
jgi:hypothetical protein